MVIETDTGPISLAAQDGRLHLDAGVAGRWLDPDQAFELAFWLRAAARVAGTEAPPDAPKLSGHSGSLLVEGEMLW